MPTRQGSIRLFQLFGITVYLHWAWFIAIWYFVSRDTGYSMPVWSVLECLSLFGIVLMHEFGHQLACRSVGGKTHDIILWPLGGVAYVTPPQRPGAQLWSITAGPLVNVGLFPVFSLVWWLGYSADWMDYPSERLPLCDVALVYQHRPACLQYVAGLSARWRTNFALAAVVCVWSRAKFDDCERRWICRCGWIDYVRNLGTIRLARYFVRFYFHQLLEWIPAGTGDVPHGRNAAT